MFRALGSGEKGDQKWERACMYDFIPWQWVTLKDISRGKKGMRI
jgi:hypothetical protein